MNGRQKDPKRQNLPSYWSSGILKRPGWIPYGLFVVYTGLFSVLGIKKFRAFNYDADFGSMLQAFYNSLDGRWMEITVCGTGPNVSRWASHTEIVYALLLPLFALFRDPWILLVMKTVCVSAGGLAVFYLARHVLKNEVSAVLCAASFWAFPFLPNNLLLNALYGDQFMILPHLMAWYFLRKGKNRAFWICIALGALSKEYVFVFNFFLGAMIFREHRGKALALFGLAAFQFFAFTPSINYLAGQGQFRLNLEQHALPVGGNRGILDVFSKAGRVMGQAQYWSRLLPVLAVFSLALWKFRRGWILLLPILGGVTLADTAPLFNNHHVSMLMAPLFITLVEGAAAIPERIRVRYLAFGVLAPSLIVLLIHPGSIVSTHLRELILYPQYRNVFHYRYTCHDRILDSLLHLVPEKVPVSSSPSIRTKLADRQYSYVPPFPWDVGQVDYFIFDFFESLDPDHDPNIRGRCGSLLASSLFSLETHMDGILIFRKDSMSASSAGNFLEKMGVPQPGMEVENGIRVVSAGVEKDERGWRMESVFSLQQPLQNGDALISFLISSRQDTLRVLHLPSFFLADLKTMEPGTYRETFMFHSDRKDLSEWRHEIALFEKNEYLPFFARSEYLLRKIFSKEVSQLQG